MTGLGPSRFIRWLFAVRYILLALVYQDLPATPPRTGTGRTFIPLILARPAY
jgi:hypothetical protein